MYMYIAMYCTYVQYEYLSDRKGERAHEFFFCLDMLLLYHTEYLKFSQLCIWERQNSKGFIAIGA